MRGTFANIRIKNVMMGPGRRGRRTRSPAGGEQMPIYDAAMQYQAAGVPLVVIAGGSTAPAQPRLGRQGHARCSASAP